MHLYAAVEFGVEAAGRWVVDYADAADGVLERVDAIGLGVDVAEFAILLEPCDDGVGTVFGESPVAVEAYFTGIWAGVVVLTCGETLDMDCRYDARVDDVAYLLHGGFVGMLGYVAFVGVEGGIHVGERDEKLVFGCVKVGAYHLEAVLGVEAVGVGLVVVLLREEFLVERGVVDTVVPQVLVAIDWGIVVAGFLAEADQRVDVVGERDRSFAHLVAARIFVEGEHGVGRFGGYVAGVEARE